MTQYKQNSSYGIKFSQGPVIYGVSPAHMKICFESPHFLENVLTIKQYLWAAGSGDPRQPERTEICFADANSFRPLDYNTDDLLGRDVPEEQKQGFTFEKDGERYLFPLIDPTVIFDYDGNLLHATDDIPKEQRDLAYYYREETEGSDLPIAVLGLFYGEKAIIQTRSMMGLEKVLPHLPLGTDIWEKIQDYNSKNHLWYGGSSN